MRSTILFTFGGTEIILIVIAATALHVFLDRDFKLIKATVFGLYVLLLKVLILPFIVLINTRNRILKDKDDEKDRILKDKDNETDFPTIYFQKQIFDALIILSWPILVGALYYCDSNDLLQEEINEMINNKGFLLFIAAYYLPVIISLVKEITLVPFTLVFKLEEILKNQKEE